MDVSVSSIQGWHKSFDRRLYGPDGPEEEFPVFWRYGGESAAGGGSANWRGWGFLSEARKAA
jgi:hypothetical protein